MLSDVTVAGPNKMVIESETIFTSSELPLIRPIKEYMYSHEKYLAPILGSVEMHVIVRVIYV